MTEFDARVTGYENRKDEVGELAEAFNAMAESLSQAEAKRSEFIANVSHELRTPLTNIRSYAETLSDSAGDIPPAMEKKFLGVILGESDRMTHIVQDLLTLSRFDSGRDDLKLARFSFEAAVQDLYNAVYMEAQRHSHTLELELEDEKVNPKYGILTVKGYLQKARFAPDTTIELAGTAVGLYE